MSFAQSVISVSTIMMLCSVYSFSSLSHLHFPTTSVLTNLSRRYNWLDSEKACRQDFYCIHQYSPDWHIPDSDQHMLLKSKKESFVNNPTFLRANARASTSISFPGRVLTQKGEIPHRHGPTVSLQTKPFLVDLSGITSRWSLRREEYYLSISSEVKLKVR